MIRPIVLASCLLLSACGTVQVRYSPTPMPPATALKAIERSLREAPQEMQRDVQVTPEYIKITTQATTRAGFFTPGGAVYDAVTYVYFASVRQIDIFQRRSKSWVELQDKTGRTIYEYSAADPEDAKRFADAVSAVIPSP